MSRQSQQDRIDGFFCAFGAGLFFLLAGWMLSTLPDRYRAEVNFRAKALSTSGVVTKTHTTSTCSNAGGMVPLSCTSQCDATVTFTSINGKTVTFSDDCPPAVRENQAVPVLYEPNGKARIHQRDHTVRNGVFTGAVFFSFGFVLLYLYRFSIQRSENQP